MRLEALAASADASETEARAAAAARQRGYLAQRWAPLVRLLLDSRRSPALRARCFHLSLAAALCEQALRVRADCGVTRVGLAGGVFQNRLLTEATRARLAAAGFEVLLPRVCRPTMRRSALVSWSRRPLRRTD